MGITTAVSTGNLTSTPSTLPVWSEAMSDHPRAQVHDAAVYFRVNKVLLATAEEKARREGMSLSELVRHALRRELREAA